MDRTPHKQKLLGVLDNYKWVLRSVRMTGLLTTIKNDKLLLLLKVMRKKKNPRLSTFSLKPSVPDKNHCYYIYLHTFLKLNLDFRCGEGNGTPLQYSCLENPMDGGAW